MFLIDATTNIPANSTYNTSPIFLGGNKLGSNGSLPRTVVIQGATGVVTIQLQVGIKNNNDATDPQPTPSSITWLNLGSLVKTDTITTQTINKVYIRAVITSTATTTTNVNIFVET